MNKIFKWLSWILMILGVAGVVWGFATGWPADTNDPTGQTLVNMLLRYGYFLLVAAVVILVVLTLVITGINNPKNLVKAGIFVAGVAAIVFVAYLLASGAPALNVKEADMPSAIALKWIDTLLLMSYILAAAAFCAIIFGAIRASITNK
ncbi:MAG: hypothetical protein ACOX5T_00585 [Candidatus Cryptobacteroides sp.]|jgi:hypothetical protein